MADFVYFYWKFIAVGALIVAFIVWANRPVEPQADAPGLSTTISATTTSSTTHPPASTTTGTYLTFEEYIEQETGMTFEEWAKDLAGRTPAYEANQYGCHSDGRCLDDYDVWCDENDFQYIDTRYNIVGVCYPERNRDG